MHKQPFTFWKYLLGLFVIYIIMIVTLGQEGVADETSKGLIIFVLIYSVLGFFLWVYQTIKYGRLNKREEKLRVAELERREKEAGLN